MTWIGVLASKDCIDKCTQVEKQKAKRVQKKAQENLRTVHSSLVINLWNTDGYYALPHVQGER